MKYFRILTPVLILSIAFCYTVSADQNLDRARLHFDRGYTLYQAKNFKETVAEFEQAIKLDPANKMYLSALGDTYFSLQDYQRAIDTYKESESVDPGWNWPVFRIGLCYYKINDYDSALTYFNRAK